MAADRPASRARPGASPTTLTGAMAGCPLPVSLFLASLAVPSLAAVSVGGLNLNAYRLLLLLLFVPAALGMFSGRARVPTAGDLCLLGYVGWCAIALLRNEGAGVAIEAGGVLALETLGPYMIARAYVRTERAVVGVLAALLALLLILCPLMLAEMLLGVRPFRMLFGTLFGSPWTVSQDMRLGLTRAWGPFDHAILAGVFAASGLGLVVFGLVPRIRGGRLVLIATPVIMAATTLSSGAISSLFIQFGLIAWRRIARFKARWTVLAILAAFAYGMIELVSNRTAYQVLLGYLTLNPGTAYHRLLILEYGWNLNVVREPLFGIGRSDWQRPEWMHEDSIDNFWLLTAMQSGLPALGLLLGAVVSTMVGPWLAMTPGMVDARKGWMISMLAMGLSGATVHFWGSSYVWFMFMLGLGQVMRSPVGPQRRGLPEKQPVPDRRPARRSR